MVQVHVSEGILEGEVVNNKYSGRVFNSFKGIPFAQPSVGDLRFKAPQPPKPWEGVREAKEFGPKCYQHNIFAKDQNEGSEDCLYLNVYTPNITPVKPLPVMFWVHGGAYVSGSGDDNLYGPQFLINHDVIIVTCNYRLEVLGFLCLDTEDIPGNAGMKDQVAALKWVHKNISNFGGDPNNITIFGQSAGASSCDFLCLSPMSKGFFKRAIIMSGVSLCNWARACEPRQRALALARNLGCYSEDDKELYQFFKNQPVKNLVKAQAPIAFSEKAQTKIQCYFTIADEKKFGDNERFFYGNIHDVLRKGIHEGVDVIIGYASDEGIINLGHGDSYKKSLEVARNFPEFFVSKPLSISLPLYQQMELGTKLKKHYFKDIIKDDDWQPLVKFYSMDLFVFPTLQWVKAIANTEKHKIYLFRFSCVTERNWMCKRMGLEDVVRNHPVSAHGDSTAYLFNGSVMPSDVKPETFVIIERICKMFTDFAKFGNPTPADTVGPKWLPHTKNNRNYLEIDNEIQAGTVPGEEEEHEFWRNLLKEFNQIVF